MKNFLKQWGMVVASGIAGLAVMVSVGKCSSSSSTGLTYTQIERLARPAVNEGFVRTNSNLNAYNAIGPNLDLTAGAADVINDAAVTFKALYAGACFINGALALMNAPEALVPGEVPCQATGTDILTSGTLIGLNSDFDTAAGTYATKMAGQFLPDVMRIDTSVASGYNASLCNPGAAGSPALCGGRKLDDNVMDITLAYFLNGETSPSVVPSIRNGTYYAAATSDAACSTPSQAGPCTNAANSRQGHKAVNYAAMPWSPAPY